MEFINEIQRVGKEQAGQFMKERLVTKAKDLNAPIKRKSYHYFCLEIQSHLKTLIKTKKIIKKRQKAVDGVMCKNCSNMRPDENLLY